MLLCILKKRGKDEKSSGPSHLDSPGSLCHSTHFIPFYSSFPPLALFICFSPCDLAGHLFSFLTVHQPSAEDLKERRGSHSVAGGN